jgi:hypothetical protein
MRKTNKIAGCSCWEMKRKQGLKKWTEPCLFLGIPCVSSTVREDSFRTRWILWLTASGSCCTRSNFLESKISKPFMMNNSKLQIQFKSIERSYRSDCCWIIKFIHFIEITLLCLKLNLGFIFYWLHEFG